MKILNLVEFSIKIRVHTVVIKHFLNDYKSPYRSRKQNLFNPNHL